MDFLFFLFFAFIFFNAIIGSGNKSKKKKRRTMSPGHPPQTKSNSRPSPVVHIPTSPQQQAQRAAQQAAARYAAKQAATHAPQPDEILESVKSSADRNRSRRADWGERAGPGFLSLKNLLVIAGLCFAAWMILQETGLTL